MASAAKPRVKLLCLVGFMGSGKTTIGRQLAQHLGWRFLDLDERIEERAGTTIAAIFERLGEPAFRDLEFEQLRRSLEEAFSGTVPSVIALGGGTFVQPRNLELLRAACKPADAPREGFVVWLDCPVDQLFARCVTMGNRPLFRDEPSFRRLYEERLPFYRMADFQIDSSGEPRAVAERILALGIIDAEVSEARRGKRQSEVNA